MPLDLKDIPFIANLSSGGGGNGGGSSCVDPEVIFTGLAVTIENTTGCYYKPILKADSLTHSLSSDSDLTFHVNCTMQGTNSPMGGYTCGGGSNQNNDNLQYGINFTKAELLAGIDLNSYDSTNADEVAQTGGTVTGWLVRVISINSICGAITCYDNGAGAGDGIQNLSGHIFADNGTNLYTDGYGTFPQFTTGDSFPNPTATTGGTYDNLIQAEANVLYYADSSSLGDDSFSATAFKIEIQYDTSCNTSGGCGSHSWVDGIDNDTYLAGGVGGIGGEQIFDVVEADCWNEDYIFIRYRIVAQGSCGGGTTNGAWTEGYLGEFDVIAAGVDCNGGP